jgi:hypothetical protein
MISFGYRNSTNDETLARFEHQISINTMKYHNSDIFTTSFYHLTSNNSVGFEEEIVNIIAQIIRVNSVAAGRRCRVVIVSSCRITAFTVRVIVTHQTLILSSV